MRKLYLRIVSLVGVFLFATAAFSQDPNFYIFLCFGQSNMEGQGTIEAQDKTVDSRFQVMEALNCSGLNRTQGKWYTAVPPLCRCDTKLSPIDNFGKVMVANLPSNIKIGVIHVAVAGCKIELFDKATYASYIAGEATWMQNIAAQYGNNPYGRLIDLAKLAQKDGVIKGILLHQGESNTGDANWPTKVKKIYNDMITDLSLDATKVPLLAGQVVDAAQGGQCAGFNNILTNLPGTLANSYVISSSGCTDQSDNLHFTSAGYRLLGERYAMKMLSLLPTADPTAPVVSITAPTATTAFSAPASIAITATASSTASTIASVAFYNGKTLLGTATASPYTYTWTGVAAGSYSITAVATDKAGKSTTSTAVVVNVRGPYSGTAAAIPGTIQCEEFDLGGNNLAYYDNSPGSSITPVVNYRTTEDVDIETCSDAGAGYNLGYTVAGEWTEYTVNVASAGTYNLTIRAACNGAGRTISLSAKGVTVANNIAIPNTGGWQTWQDVAVNNITLSAGVQVIRLTIGATDYVNLNYMKFALAASVIPPSVTINSPLDKSQFNASQTVTISASTASSTSTFSSVSFYNGTTLLGTDNTLPYTFDWSGMAMGNYNIIAKATDSKGTLVADTVAISILAPPATIKLRTGWNYVGCPLAGSTDIAKALSSVIDHLVVAKNFDGFYDKFAPVGQSSLNTVEWGQGYMLKVDADCVLDWIAK